MAYGDHVSARDFNLASANALPSGITTDGTYAYIVDNTDNKVYVYQLSNGARQSSREFNVSQSTSAFGIGIDSTYFYLVDSSADKINVYQISNGAYQSARSINLASGNGDPSGITIDDGYAYVLDRIDKKVYVYRLSNRTRDTSREFDLGTGNDHPFGITTDGTYAYVVDLIDRKVFGYLLSDGSRESTKDFSFASENASSVGITTDGTYLYTVDNRDDKVYAYETTPPIPDASVAATINVPSTGAERTTVRLSASVTGNYDSISYTWTVAEGTLNNASAASPTWTRPTVSSGKTVAIGLSVSVTGTGTNAQSGTSANASATAVSPRVTDNTPVASAPSVTIDSVSAGREGTTVSLSAAITGGTYDSLEYTWTVAEGTLNDATAQSPTWTRPTVTATKDVAIGLSLKAKGTGTKADPGTSATVNATAVNASVTDTPLLPLAVAPSVTIDAVANGNENTTVKLTASISGGTYDGLDYLWSVGGGTLDDATLESPTWTRPAVSADTEYNINLRVTANGTGTNARSGSSTQKNAGHVVATVLDVPVTPVTPNASAPAVAINNIAAGREGTTVVLGATLTGGTYDAIDYAWTVAEGTLDDATLAAPTWTRPTVTATKNVAVGLSITAKGTGTNAVNGTSASASATSKNASVTDTPAAGVSYQAMELRAGWHDYQATPKRHRWDPSASERPQIIDTLIDSRDIFLSRFLIRDDLIAMQFTTDRLGGLTSHAGADLSSTFETGGYIGIDDGDGHTVVFQVTDFDNTDSLEPYAWRMSGAATTKMAAFISELTAVSATQAITLTLWDGEGDSPFTEPEESAFTNVAVTGRTVVLTLRTAITSGQTLELDYTKGTNPIQDSAGNDAANLVDESVTNNVT